MLQNITNPYYSGCLLAKYPGWTQPRVCSPRHELSEHCRPPPFDYLEIRMGTGNWDSATALGWLAQIVLSEVLGVPTSIETNAWQSSRDFYDPQATLDYQTSMSAAPLVTANALADGDCLSIHNTNAEDYQACAHFMPEFWHYPATEIQQQQVEPPQGTGYLGQEGWYLTKFTAQAHPELVSYHGYYNNREKLAHLFRQPTTWGDYCSFVSLDNCSVPDAVAQRAPHNDTEAQRMFAGRELYRGHFRVTRQNNCTENENCVGHFANYPCGVSVN